MRETGKEVATKIDSGMINADEIHRWLAEATAKEVSDYLRWVPAKGPWAEHGRDTLNVVLANGNIKLQATIKRLTICIFILTLFMAVIAGFQFYKSFIDSNNTIATTINIPATIPTPVTSDNETDKNIPKENNKNVLPNKTNSIKHQEIPSK